MTSRSGCSSGSPPLMSIALVPSIASRSTRPSISCVGTGSELLSYSLQYAHDRLHRRIGTIWARIGCRADLSARANIRTSRRRREVLRPARRTVRKLLRATLTTLSFRSSRYALSPLALACSWEHRRVASGRYPRMRRIPPSELTGMRCTRGRGPGRAVELRTLPSSGHPANARGLCRRVMQRAKQDSCSRQ